MVTATSKISLQSRILLAASISVLVVLLVACGNDSENSRDSALDADPSATEQSNPEPTATPEIDPTPTPEPAETEEPENSNEPTSTPEADPTTTPEPEPEPEPESDVDLAPELAGLTDWRNSDPLTLEELRGEPVVLVFWNSI